MVGQAFTGLSIAAGVIYAIILTAFVFLAIYYIWKKRSEFPRRAKEQSIHYMVYCGTYIYK